MRIKKLGVVLILPAVAVCGTSTRSHAQPPASVPSTSAPVIPLELEGTSPTSSSAGTVPVSSLQNPFGGGTPQIPATASPQRYRQPVVASPQAGRPPIGQLQNPYQWNGGPEQSTGLFGMMRRRQVEPRVIAASPQSNPTRPSQQSDPSGVPGPSPQGGQSSGTGRGYAPGTGGSAQSGQGMPGTGSPYDGSMPGTGAPNTGADGTTPPVTTPPGDAGTAAGAAALNAANADDGGGGAGPGLGGGLGSNQEAVPMIGDMSPYRLNAFGGGRFSAFATTPTAPAAPPGVPGVNPPTPPGARAGQIFYPSVRVFKISENQSPRPQDRVFFNMNTFYQVNQDVNRRFEVPIKDITAYRYFFGFEKTFNDGKGSIGIRFPIDTISATPTLRGVQTPASTSTGNLSIFGKHILVEDKKTGSLVSVGLAITPPTGPTKFAGAPWLFGLRSTAFQPFIGFIWNKGDFYVHGFSAFDFTVNVNDVSLMYNDFGAGYYLFRTNDPDRFLTALVPTFEVHVNTPLNHRDWYNPSDLAGTADVVNLTYGCNFEFKRRAILTTALITPVSSPKPFTAELAVLLNIYYGRTRASRIQITPPPVL